jgi:hypothetical protein
MALFMRTLLESQQLSQHVKQISVHEPQRQEGNRCAFKNIDDITIDLLLCRIAEYETALRCCFCVKEGLWDLLDNEDIDLIHDPSTHRMVCEFEDRVRDWVHTTKCLTIILPQLERVSIIYS